MADQPEDKLLVLANGHLVSTLTTISFVWSASDGAQVEVIGLPIEGDDAPLHSIGAVGDPCELRVLSCIHGDGLFLRGRIADQTKFSIRIDKATDFRADEPMLARLLSGARRL